MVPNKYFPAKLSGFHALRLNSRLLTCHHVGHTEYHQFDLRRLNTLRKTILIVRCLAQFGQANLTFAGCLANLPLSG